MNKLQIIGLALHNYHEKYGSFPPASTVDANGRRLHSWWTLLLPFLDNAALARQIDLSQPWDDPANAEFRAMSLRFYSCPTTPGRSPRTSYLAIVSPRTGMPPDGLAVSDFGDGLVGTWIIVEVDVEHSVDWMEPRDVDEAFVLEIGKTSGVNHETAFHVLTAKGTVEEVDISLPAEERRRHLRFSKRIDAAGVDR